MEYSLKTIAKKYNLKLLLLFGSRADGTARKASDFDIAYYSNRELTLMDEARLIFDLSPIVKSENIDLVNLKKAPPLLYYSVFQNPKILFAKDDFIFYNLRAYAFKKYVEAKPLFEIRSQYLKESLGGK